ncbi:alcohol dehydrogenase [NADP(+)] [Elysia marginata]|uniref:Alcohol dehydrogenase [NADP(+)] n=1 Tax=Elysia marginata TaxID=1093978 RepID=A0AAV4EFZ1_9GAST|nr:alcohol dehydrogenase [NADP(+)] [Elysia marginata]
MSRCMILNTGSKMPTIGFGTYLLTGDALRSSLDYALFLGYRLIDTAYRYGNEADIGQVLKDRIKAGKLKRKEVFITTKIMKTHLKRAATIHCHQKSLHDLGTSYADSVLIHNPWGVLDYGSNGNVKFDTTHFTETWSALQSLFQGGSARSIGVSNFTVKQLETILGCSGPPPSHLQLECHAYLAQNKLKNFCDLNKIIVTAFAPLGAPARQGDSSEKEKRLLSDPCIVQISKRVKKSPAQVLLKFLLQRGFVVIPKSSNNDRIKENFELTNWKLSHKDMDMIFKLDCGVRYFKFNSSKGHPEYFPDEDF